MSTQQRVDVQSSRVASLGAFSTSVVQSMKKNPSTVKAIASAFERFDIQKLERVLRKPRVAGQAIAKGSL
jgi:hypothetical protein